MSIKSNSSSSISTGAKAFSFTSGLGTYSNPATGAQELYDAGIRTDGPYWIKASATSPKQKIYCILDSSWGAGWMIVAHNSAREILYTSKHIPRLTSNKEFVGSSGPNSYDFNYNWSIDMTGIYFSELAWVGYSGATAEIVSYSLTSNILTVNTAAPHNFKLNTNVTLNTGNATIDGDRVIYDIPSSTSFRILVLAANISFTSATSTVYGIKDSLDVKGTIVTHMYGTFNTPTYIPNSRKYCRVFDNPARGKYLSFIGATKELTMEASGAGVRSWKWIGLYDSRSGDPFLAPESQTNYTLPISAIGDSPNNLTYPMQNSDTVCQGVFGIFSFADRDVIERDNARLGPPYGTGASGGDVYGLDDYQDGNSLGDAWGTNGINSLGKGCPSYIMIKA
jgi:hypothetical protein